MTIASLSITAISVSYAGEIYAAEDVKKTSNDTVKVDAVKVSEVVLDKNKAEVTEGATLQLTASIKPSDAADKGITWTSSNTNVATVDAKGKVSAKKSGTVKISVKTKDGGKTATCTVIVKEKPVPKKNGWKYEDGGWKYYKDDKAYTGWNWMSKEEGEKTGHWSYFGKDGKIYTGWHKMGKAEGEKTPHWSYFGDNGWLRTGWVQLGKGTNNPDGNNKAHWSYFGPNGWLRTGWHQMGTKSNPDGKNKVHWSYFGDNGWLRTGWVQLGKGTSEPDGNSAVHWSYFGPNGWLRTGMQSMATSANPDGKNKQHQSFFGSNGWLVENKVLTYNKVQYIADSKGWLTAVKSEHEKTLARAMQLVSKITNDNMTKEQKLRTCFNHIRDSYPEKNPRIPHYSGAGWHTLYANDIFVNKYGNCFSDAAAFGYMAKAIGYDNVYVCNTTGYKAPHGWTEINGLIYDTEWERNHSGNYFGISYNTNRPQDHKYYKQIFNITNSYAKIKL